MKCEITKVILASSSRKNKKRAKRRKTDNKTVRKLKYTKVSCLYLKNINSVVIVVSNREGFSNNLKLQPCKKIIIKFP